MIYTDQCWPDSYILYSVSVSVNVSVNVNVSVSVSVYVLFVRRFIRH